MYLQLSNLVEAVGLPFVGPALDYFEYGLSRLEGWMNRTPDQQAKLRDFPGVSGQAPVGMSEGHRYWNEEDVSPWMPDSRAFTCRFGHQMSGSTFPEFSSSKPVFFRLITSVADDRRKPGDILGDRDICNLFLDIHLRDDGSQHGSLVCCLLVVDVHEWFRSADERVVYPLFWEIPQEPLLVPDPLAPDAPPGPAPQLLLKGTSSSILSVVHLSTYGANAVFTTKLDGPYHLYRNSELVLVCYLPSGSADLPLEISVNLGFQVNQ
jgi:hypothetical protein